jgi:hypothetical protein
MIASSIALAFLAVGPLDAPVTAAVVYSDRARVTRAADVAVDGATTVELPLLPPGTDADSVRVETAGGPVAIDSVEIGRVGPANLPIEAARAALRRMERLDDEIALATFEDGAIGRAVAAAGKAPLPPDDGDPTWAAIPAGRWRQTLRFLEQWSARTDERRAQVGDRLAGLRQLRTGLAAEAERLVKGDEGRVRVVVRLAGRGRAHLQMKYMVVGPRWIPRYEVRLDKDRDEVTVTLAALVQQSTGEDWLDARLALSTAVPTVSAALPELPRWRLGERERFIPEFRARPEPAATAPAVVATVAPRPPPQAEEQALRLVLREQVLRAARADQTAAAPPPTPAAVSAAEPAAPAPARSEPPVAPSGIGVINGAIYDQNGNPIRGVKVRAERQEGGVPARVGYSNDAGEFRIGGLANGRYQVTAQAPKLRTAHQRGIEVRPGQPTDVFLIMEAPTSVEEVRVVERAPIVSTTTASVREVYDIRYGDAAPLVASSTVHGASERVDVVTLAPPPGHRQPPLAPDVPAVLAGGRSLVFEAIARESVPTGAMARRVALGTWRWPVALERRVVAAARPEGFVLGALRSPAKTPLPAGPAVLFVGAEPVGHARLELVRPGQPFVLPLGLDRGVRATRQVRLESAQTGLINKDEVNRYTVVTEVANAHGRPVQIEVVDQVPRARDDSVTVRVESTGAGAIHDREKDTVTWRARLPAGGAARFTLVYTLRRSSGHRLHQQ